MPYRFIGTTLGLAGSKKLVQCCSEMIEMGHNSAYSTAFSIFLPHEL